MTDTKLTTTRTVADYDLRFVWHGGQYIDISFGHGAPFDVINTISGDDGAPMYPFTRAGLKQAVDEYVNDPETDHAHDLHEYYVTALNNAMYS